MFSFSNNYNVRTQYKVMCSLFYLTNSPECYCF